MKTKKKHVYCIRCVTLLLTLCVGFSQPLTTLAASGVRIDTSAIQNMLKAMNFSSSKGENEVALGIQTEEGEEQVTFHAQMQNLDSNDITEYGFIWSIDVANPNPTLTHHDGIDSVKEKPEGDAFYFQQKYPVEEVYFVRSYVKTKGLINSNTVYSPSLAVKRDNTAWQNSYSAFEHFENAMIQDDGLVQLKASHFNTMGWDKFYGEADIAENVVVNAYGFLVSYGLNEPDITHYDEIAQNQEDGFDFFRFNLDSGKFLQAKIRPFIIYNNQFVKYAETIQVKGEREVSMQPRTTAYADLQDGVAYYAQHYQELIAENDVDSALLKKLVWPRVEAGSGGGSSNILQGVLAEDYGHSIQEYGFVWSSSEVHPTITSHDGMHSFTSQKDTALFEHAIQTSGPMYARAYVVYDNAYVAYSNQISTQSNEIQSASGNLRLESPKEIEQEVKEAPPEEVKEKAEQVPPVEHQKDNEQKEEKGEEPPVKEEATEQKEQPSQEASQSEEQKQPEEGTPANDVPKAEQKPANTEEPPKEEKDKNLLSKGWDMLKSMFVISAKATSDEATEAEKDAAPETKTVKYDTSRRDDLQKGSNVPLYNAGDEYTWFLNLSTDQSLATMTKLLPIDDTTYQRLCSEGSMYLIYRGDVLGKTNVKFNGFDLGSMRKENSGYVYYVYEIHDYMLRNGNNVLELFSPVFTAVSIGDVQIVTNNGPLTQDSAVSAFQLQDTQYQQNENGAQAIIHAKATVQNGLTNNLKLTTVNMIETLNAGTFDAGGQEELDITQGNKSEHALTFTLPMAVESVANYATYQILTTAESNQVLAIQQTRLYRNSANMISDFTVEYEPATDRYTDVLPTSVKGYLLPLKTKGIAPLSKDDKIEQTENENGITTSFTMEASEKGFVSQPFYQDGKDAFQAYYHIGNMDTTIPVIALRGSTDVTMLAGGKYQEQGFELVHKDFASVDNDPMNYKAFGYEVTTACFKKDGNNALTPVEDYATRFMEAGIYEIHYNAVDITGHAAKQQIRTISVLQDDLLLQTLEAETSGKDDVVLYGKIEKLGSFDIAERGFFIKEVKEDDTSVTILNYDAKHIVDKDSTNTNQFSKAISKQTLHANQVYAYASYAKNVNGHIQIGPVQTFQYNLNDGEVILEDVTTDADGYGYTMKITRKGGENPARIWYRTVDGSAISGASNSGGFYEHIHDYVDLKPEEYEIIKINAWPGGSVAERYGNQEKRTFYFEVYKAETFKDTYASENVIMHLNVNGAYQTLSKHVESNYDKNVFTGMTYQTYNMYQGHSIDDYEAEIGDPWEENQKHQINLNDQTKYIRDGNKMQLQYTFNFKDHSWWGASKIQLKAKLFYDGGNKAEIGSWIKNVSRNETGSVTMGYYDVSETYSFVTKHSAGGLSNNKWDLSNAKFNWRIQDDRDPYIKQMRMSDTKCVPGQRVYASVLFNEPVEVNNTPFIQVRVGNEGTILNLEYATGSGTDILSFIGTVDDDSTSGVPILFNNKIQGFNNIKDFSGRIFENTTLSNANTSAKINIEMPTDYASDKAAKQWLASVHVEENESIQYVWDTHSSITADTAGWQPMENGQSITTPEGVSGTYYLHVQAGDGAKTSEPFIVDNEAPSLQLTHEASDPSADDGFEDGNNGKYSANIKFKAKVIDQNVSIAEGDTLYQITNSENFPSDDGWILFKDNTATSVKSITKSDVYYLHFKIKDKAGNMGQQTSKPYYVDIDAPSLFEDQIQISNITENGFRVDIKDVKDAGEGNEEMLPSGIRTIYIESRWENNGPREDTMTQFIHTSTDGKVTKDFQYDMRLDRKQVFSQDIHLEDGLSQLTSGFTQDGICHLTFKVVDNAGNIKQVKKDVTLSSIKPELTIHNINGEEDIYRREPVRMQAIAKKAENGKVLTSLTLPDGTVIKDNSARDENKTTGIIVSEYLAVDNGEYVFIASDEAGGTQQRFVTVNNIDRTPPKVLVQEKEEPNHFTVTLEDEHTVVYQMDQGVFQAYKEPFTISLQERDFFTITAYDAAGNQMVYTYKKPYQPTQPEGEDHEAPVITIIGNEEMHVTKGSRYIEYGVYVKDNQDANPKVKIIDSDLDINQAGVYTIVYVVTDASGNSTTATRKVIVDEQGSMELAFDEVSVDNHSGYEIKLEQLQSTLEVNRIYAVVPTTITSEKGYVNMQVVQDEMGIKSIHIKPKQYFNGKDTFQIQVQTDTKGLVTCTVNVTFANVENAPQAKDDNYANVYEGPFLVINALEESGYIPHVLPVLDNDSDPDIPMHGEPYLSMDVIHIKQILSNGQKGTARISDDGKTLLYTPDQYKRGEDTLVYEISDQLGHTSQARVTLYIRDTVKPQVESVRAYLKDTMNEFALDEDHYTNKSLTLTLRMLDYYADGSGGSGVKKLELKKEQDGQIIYEEKAITHANDTIYTFDVEENATYVYRITDDDGNWIEKAIVVDKIDKQAPLLQAVWDQTTSLTGVDLDITFGDEGVSGYDTFTVQRDHQNKEDLWEIATILKEEGQGSYHVTNNGKYTFILMDRAGNRVEQTIDVQAIDHAPPTISWKSEPAGLTYGEPATLHLHAQDTISNIAKIRYPDGTEEKIAKEEQQKERDFTFEAKQNGRYRFTVWDSLGLSSMITINVTNIASKEVPPTELIVNKESVELYINGKNEDKVSAIAGPEDATNKMIDWTSSHPDYVSVRDDGTMSALKETIDLQVPVVVTASLNGAPDIRKEVTVNVTNVVEKISFDKDEILLNNNQTMDFNAYANGYRLEMKDAASVETGKQESNKRLLYASSNENVFTVDKNGVVKALYPGNGLLTVMSDNGVIGSCVITVVIPVEKVNYNDVNYHEDTREWETSLTQDSERTFASSVYPITATNPKITYELEAGSEEFVSLTNANTGNIKAIKEGVAYLRAVSVFDTSIYARLKLTVIPKDTGITLNTTEDTLYIGEQMRLEGVVEPAQSPFLDRTITYASDNPNIASVDTDGTVHANYAGKAKITAKTVSGNTAISEITVKKVVEKVELSSANLSMYTGQLRGVSAFVEPEQAEGQSVHWYVKDNDENNPVVLVDENTGMITALRSGTATVVAAARKTAHTPSDKVVPQAECVVHVTTPVNQLYLFYYEAEGMDETKDHTQNPEAIRYPFYENGEDKVVNIAEGRSMQLAAEVNADADDKEITWTSSHPNNLKIDAKTGRVQALQGDNNILITITATTSNMIVKQVNMKVGEQVGDFKVNHVNTWITAESQKEYKNLSEFNLETMFSNEYEGNRTVTFETLNTDIVDIEVTSSGKAIITGKKEGVAYVKAIPEADSSLSVTVRVLVDHIMTQEDIPDKILFKELTKQIDLDGATEGSGDGYLRRTEMREYNNTIEVAHKGIKDITGANELLMVTALNLSNNVIEKGIQALTYMEQLQMLDLSQTGMQNYAFLDKEGKARYQNLQTLKIAGNDIDEKITDKLALYSNLKTLDISNNRIKNMDAFGSFPLTRLDVAYNELISPRRAQIVLDTLKNQNASFKGVVSYQGPKDGDKLDHDAMVWCGVGGTVVKEIDDKYYNLSKNVKYNYFDKGLHYFETYLTTDTEITKIKVDVDCESRELKMFKENTGKSTPQKGEYSFDSASGAMIMVEDREYFTNASGVVRIGYPKGYDGELTINYTDNLAVDITGESEGQGGALGTPGKEYIIQRKLSDLPINNKVYLYKSGIARAEMKSTEDEKPLLAMLQMNKEGTSSTTYDVMQDSIDIEKALRENYTLLANVDWVGHSAGTVEFGMFNIQNATDASKYQEASDPYAQKQMFIPILTLQDKEETKLLSLTKTLREKIVLDNTTSIYIHLIENGKESFYKLPINLFQYIRTDGSVAGSNASSDKKTDGSFGFDNGFEAGFGYGPVNASFVYDGEEFCVSAGFTLDITPNDKKDEDATATTTNDGSNGTVSNTASTAQSANQSTSDVNTEISDLQKVKKAVSSGNDTQERFNRMKKRFSEKGVGGFMKEGFKPAPNKAVSDFMDAGVSLDFSLSVYGIMLDKKDGSKFSYCTAGTMSVGVGVAWEFTYPVMIGFIPAYTKIELSANVGVSLNVKGPVAVGSDVVDAAEMQEKYNTGWDDTTGTITTGVGAELTLAVGVDGLLSAGVKGDVGVELEATLGKRENSDGTFKFETGASVFVAILFFEFSKSFASYEFKTGFNKDAKSNENRIMMQVEGAGITSRSYALNPSVFYQDVNASAKTAKQVAHGEAPENRSNVDLSLIEANVYPYAQPEYVDLQDGRQMLVWIDDNRERESVNKTTLYYAIRENGVWSKKQAVDDDGTADFSPVIRVEGRKVYLAWQNSKNTYKDHEIKRYSDDLQKRLLSEMSIKTAIYDIDKDEAFKVIEGEFDTQENYHANVKIAANQNGKSVVVWSVNDRNALLGNEGRDVIYYSEYKDGVYGEPVEVVSTLSTITYIDVQYEGDQFYIVYNEDRDNDLQTGHDKELYLFEKGKGVKQLTDDLSMDVNPNLIKEDGTLKLYWIKDDKICVMNQLQDQNYTSIMNGDKTLATDRLSFVNGYGHKAIFWEAQSDATTTDVYAMFYDRASNTWSDATKITNAYKRLSPPSGFFDASGSLQSVTIVRDIEALDYIENEEGADLTTEKLGEANLSELHMKPAYDIGIHNITYDRTLVSAGNEVTFFAEITNYGQKPVRSVDIAMYHKGRKVNQVNVKPLKENSVPQNVNGNAFVQTDYEETVLQPGQTTPVKFTYTMPDAYEEYTLNLDVSVKGETDLEPRDNTYEIVFEESNLRLYVDKIHEKGTKRALEYRIANAGGKKLNDITIALQYKDTKEVVKSTVLKDLEPGKTFQSEFEVDVDELDFQQAGYREFELVISSDYHEVTQTDNMVTTVLQNVDDAFVVRNLFEFKDKNVSVRLGEEKATSLLMGELQDAMDTRMDVEEETSLIELPVEKSSIVYSSDNPNVVSIDENGNLIAKGAGNTIVKAYHVLYDMEAECHVSVDVPVQSVSIAKEKVHVAVGLNEGIYATVQPNNATNKNVTWISDDESVAVVAAQKVYGVAPGTTTLHAVSEDGAYRDSVIVQVSSRVTGIRVVETQITMTEGTQSKLQAQVLPEDAANQNIHYVSNKESVVQVNTDGTLVAGKPGTAIVTAASAEGNFQKDCIVTVVKKPNPDVPVKPNEPDEDPGDIGNETDTGDGTVQVTPGITTDTTPKPVINQTQSKDTTPVSGDSPILDLTKNTLVTKEQIQKMLDENGVFVFYDKDGKILYSWKFDVKDKAVKIPDELDLGIAFSSKYRNQMMKLSHGYEGFFLSTKYRGALFSEAEITVRLDEAWRKAHPGKTLYVYYYDEKQNKLILLESGLTEKAGYVSFHTTKGGDFMISDKRIDEKAEENKTTKTPEIESEKSTPWWPYAVGIMLVICAGAVIVYKRKKSDS